MNSEDPHDMVRLAAAANPFQAHIRRTNARNSAVFPEHGLIDLREAGFVRIADRRRSHP